MTLSRLFAVSLLSSALPLLAQPPGGRGVALGHIHLNSANPEAALSFWTETIGAAVYDRGSLRGVSMIGGLILISQGDAPGPGAGSVIDRIGLHVPDLQPFLSRLEKTKYKSSPVPGVEGQVLIEGPDGIRIQLDEDSSRFAPLEFGYVHLSSPQPAEMQAWYAKNFGARAANEENTVASRVGGGLVIFDKDASAKPSAGRAFDHVAFEVRGLEEFCRKLAADGIRFDSPYASTPELKMSSAFLTDPWGVRIELTEGLAR